MEDLPLLLGAGFLAGSMNAVAGGGSFVAFPALVLAGVPSVGANASCAVALLPGSLASSYVYRDGLRGDGPSGDGLAGIGEVRLRTMLAVSLAGGLLGAALLLSTPQAEFDAVIPWLLLLATLAFAFGGQAGAALRRVARIGPAPVVAVQFVLAVYGGYFGGAVGIMMMAAWSLLGAADRKVPDLKAMAPARTVLVAATNAAAVACFVALGAVRWPQTLAVLLAGIAGGYGGARLGQRLDRRAIRAAILVLTTAMTIFFFRRAP